MLIYFCAEHFEIDLCETRRRFRPQKRQQLLLRIDIVAVAWWSAPLSLPEEVAQLICQPVERNQIRVHSIIGQQSNRLSGISQIIGQLHAAKVQIASRRAAEIENAKPFGVQQKLDAL